MIEGYFEACEGLACCVMRFRDVEGINAYSPTVLLVKWKGPLSGDLQHHFGLAVKPSDHWLEIGPEKGEYPKEQVWYIMGLQVGGAPASPSVGA